MSRELRDRADIVSRELRELLRPISNEIQSQRVENGSISLYKKRRSLPLGER